MNRLKLRITPGDPYALYVHESFFKAKHDEVRCQGQDFVIKHLLSCFSACGFHLWVLHFECLFFAFYANADSLAY